MLALHEMQEILDNVSYTDRAGEVWAFHLKEDASNQPYLQVSFVDPREVDYIQTSRKWRLSYHMTKSEVVWTAFAAVRMAEEHEMRENFRYKDARIGGPHLDVEVLADVARKRVNLDLRENAQIVPGEVAEAPLEALK